MHRVELVELVIRVFTNLPIPVTRLRSDHFFSHLTPKTNRRVIKTKVVVSKKERNMNAKQENQLTFRAKSGIL